MTLTYVFCNTRPPQILAISVGNSINSNCTAIYFLQYITTISKLPYHTYYIAGGKGQVRAYISNPATLILRGFSLATIVQMSDANIENSDIITFINSIHASIDSLKSLPTGQSCQELKLKIPIGSAGRPYVEPTKGLLPREISDATESKLEYWPKGFEARIGKIGSIQEMMKFLKKPQNVRKTVWKYWHTVAEFMKRISNGTFCVGISMRIY